MPALAGAISCTFQLTRSTVVATRTVPSPKLLFGPCVPYHTTSRSPTPVAPEM